MIYTEIQDVVGYKMKWLSTRLPTICSKHTKNYQAMVIVPYVPRAQREIYAKHTFKANPTTHQPTHKNVISPTRAGYLTVPYL